MNGLAGFTLSEFGTARPHCSSFITVSYLISLQLFDWSTRVTFSVFVFPSFFTLTTSSPLSVLSTVGLLLELHAIRSFPLSLVGLTLDGYFSAPEVARCFYWWERVCLLSPTPDVICLLPFLLLPSTCFNMSRFMGAMSIELSETSVESSSPDIPVTKYVAISWTPAFVLCVWCFNGNINSSR